jgi:ribosome-associated protein
MSEESIDLDQFLKYCQVAATGGQAKRMIQGGQVQVNGQVETRRRRKLRPGDVVQVLGETFALEADDSSPPGEVHIDLDAEAPEERSGEERSGEEDSPAG